MSDLKLFMILLGCKPPGRHTEQHDFFFGIAHSIKELVPEIEAFWPQPGEIHIDAWREVNVVNDQRITIRLKSSAEIQASGNIHVKSPARLFFINLGGYTRNKFEEQHYVFLTVADNKAEAFKTAKDTFFFKTVHFENAKSHIDDKYGIDVDDLYQIEEVLSSQQKNMYQIEITPSAGLTEDTINLGYFKLNSF